jgi:OPT oligopeptide transporter protein
MLVGWGVLSPLSKHLGWAPGPVGDMTTGARGWILWTSLSIMCTDSVVSLLPVAWEFMCKAAKRRNQSATDSDDDHDKPDDEIETADRLVPGSWVLWGLLISVVFGTAVVWSVFGNEGIKPWATLIGFGMGGLLSILG